MAQTVLLVEYLQTRYALAVSAVDQIVWLPALSTVEELPPWVRGVFTLRGGAVPVVDLDLRFGRSPGPLAVQDRVVVLKQDHYRIGVRVGDVHEVVTVADHAIDLADQYQLPWGSRRFVRGVVKLEDGVAMLLDVAALLHESASMELPPPELLSGGVEPCQESEAELAIFRQRAISLAITQDLDGHADVHSYAVFRIGDELWGVAAALVIEFMHRRGLVPIPGTPSHFAGAMNRRGEILTVLDIRRFLGLAVTNPTPQVMVLQQGELSVGLLIEATYDVVAIADAAIAPAKTSDDPLCAGVARPEDILVRLLSMEKLTAALLAARDSDHSAQ